MKQLEKSIKKLIQKIIICIIIREVIKGNITLSEVYELIDKTIEANKIRKREQRLFEIEQENVRFQRIVNRARNERNDKSTNRTSDDKNNSYKSFIQNNEK